jgi:transposase
MKEADCSVADIAAACHRARSTVRSTIARAENAGIDYECARLLECGELEELLYPKKVSEHKRPEPDWESIHKGLTTRSKSNLQFEWEEYIKEHPDGYRYSYFCELYARWRDEAIRKVIMVQSRRPGYELFVDWAGDSLECVVDACSGEASKAYFFISTLGDSGYPFVRAFPNMGQDSWIAAHVENFKYLGGLPTIVVPDNCKTAVTKPSYYDPVLNPAYRELACHYNVAIVPARVRKPKDKAPAENAVGWLETWLLEWIVRQGPFFSFEELNSAIDCRMAELVKRPFQQRCGSRSEAFELIDKDALRPLPKHHFHLAEWINRKVGTTYHVRYKDTNYSVPYELFGTTVTLKADSRIIEIFDTKQKRAALHTTNHNPKIRYITVPEHMPPAHRAQRQFNERTGDDYRRLAQRIGKDVGLFVEALLKKYPWEQTSYRSCQAVIGFAHKTSPEIVNKACKQALADSQISYGYLKMLLEEKATKRPATTSHENIRGACAFT